MQNKNFVNFTHVVVVLLSVFYLSACGWIKGYLPDKERDYHYSKEIPELELPSDLSNQVLEMQANPPVYPGQPISNSEQPAEHSAAIESQKSETDVVRLVFFDGGATRIQIDAPFNKSWRIVGKALSHQSIEITGRDRNIGTYFVLYDPNKRAYEDGSLWDEVMFFFGDDQYQEKAYHIRLASTDQLTEVIVTDAADTPMSSGPALRLLTLLFETIKADFEDG